MILNLGGEFINYEGKDKYGRTMLLFSSQSLEYALKPHFIKVLLDRGASVMARNIFGQTCLHLVLESIRFPEINSDKVSVSLLVKAGADVYAKDKNGMSVSDVAYTPFFVGRSYNLGTYRRHLWDEILTECGYDPAAFHGQFQELEEVFDSEEEFSGSDEREWMIEEQDCEMDG